MRGVKPFKLSFISRPFQYLRQNRLGVGVLAYFDLGSGELRTDMEMWSDVPDLLGKDVVLDVGMPKSRAEFLVVGSAHQPGGVPAPLRRVRAAVGEQEKILYVIGDREWKRGVPTEPKPFVEMPITWENAFGGEGYAPNPRGKGFAPIAGEGGEQAHPLPNIELPGAMIDALGDRPQPASFRPLDFMWPQRFSLAGTYDQAWLDTLYPGLARDIDWRIWNTAAPDQQREQPFAPGEPIVLEHLHPTKQKVEGRVPALRARCFVRMLRADGPTFEEVELRLTTLWLFPAIERGILIWHGAQSCAEDDAADVDVLMVAAEASDAPRSLDHYRDVMERRIGPDRAVEVLNDDDLVPPGQAGMGGEIEAHMELTTPRNLVAERRRKEAEAGFEAARKTIAEAGLDPDEHGPKDMPSERAVPPLDKLGELQKQVMAEVEELRKKGLKHREEATARAKAFYEEVGLDYSVVEKEKSQPARRGPPTFSADGERESMRKIAEECAAAGRPIPEIEFYAIDDGRYQLWKRAEREEMQAYRTFAHHQAPAFALSAEASAERRAGVRAAIETAKSMAGWDLTGADLSELDLAGADLSMALMESVDLRGTRLAGANLSGAVLAHASLTDTILDGADLRGANLGKAALTRTSLRAADLRGATLEGAVIRDACFVEAKVPELKMREAELAGVDFSRADLTEAIFHDTKLEGVVWTGARLLRSHFIGVTAAEQDFSGADLSSSTLIRFSAPRAKLRGAILTGLRFMEGGSLEGADLREADLSKANLRGVVLIGADLSGARLDGADVSGADMTRARLSGIRARRSLWIRTVLRDAFAVNADLFESLLSKADLRGTDLRGANLYGADFALVHGDDATNVKGAITDRVRAKPVRQA